nr:MAG TPA: hypothetical protein [Caudoviricetes sp.]
MFPPVCGCLSLTVSILYISSVVLSMLFAKIFRIFCKRWRKVGVYVAHAKLCKILQ